jgi:hypothetical protein
MEFCYYIKQKVLQFSLKIDLEDLPPDLLDSQEHF